jgi:Sarcosine oxidase, delta subunit family
MLLIPCPWCGEREETEFRCGGEAHPIAAPRAGALRQRPAGRGRHRNRRALRMAEGVPGRGEMGMKHVRAILLIAVVRRAGNGQNPDQIE